jgi:hypothetical protein
MSVRFALINTACCLKFGDLFITEVGRGVTNFYCGRFHGQRTSDFGGPPSIDDAVVFDEISDDAKSIVKRPFGFVNNLYIRLAFPACNQPTHLEMG